MKIVFVHNGYESLGIEYLSASLRAAGHETALVIDPCLFDEAGFWHSPALARIFSYREAVLRRVKALKPDLVGFSVFTDTWPWALDLAREIKKRTGAMTVFGGIHPSSAPEAVLAEEAVDFICLGEGDLALPALAAFLRSGGPLPTGIRTKKDGAGLKGPPAGPAGRPGRPAFPGQGPFSGRRPRLFGGLPGFLFARLPSCLFLLLQQRVQRALQSLRGALPAAPRDRECPEGA